MTAPAYFPTTAAMHRPGWFLLLALLAVALTASSAAHAREALGSATISCSGETHADGDGDQVPGDADQGVPHHHGNCHGHAVALRTGAMESVHPLPLASCAFASPAADLASFLVDPALRPPRV